MPPSRPGVPGPRAGPGVPVPAGPAVSPPRCLSPAGDAGLLREVRPHQHRGHFSTAPLSAARAACAGCSHSRDLRDQRHRWPRLAPPARPGAQPAQGRGGRAWPKGTCGVLLLRSQLTERRGFVIAAPLPCALGLSACVKAAFVSHQLVFD